MKENMEEDDETRTKNGIFLFLQAENSNSDTPPAGVLAVTKDNRVDGRVTLRVCLHCSHFAVT